MKPIQECSNCAESEVIDGKLACNKWGMWTTPDKWCAAYDRKEEELPE